MTITKQQQGKHRCLTAQEIGGAVAVFRRAADMKQITLAHHAALTERTVQRIEKGDKVNDESLRAIARALRMDAESFIGARYIPSKEEAVADVLEQLEQRRLIDAHRFATLRDAEAVLGTSGMLIDDHFVADDAATEAADLRDLLRDWNDIYSEMYSAAEKLKACRSLLSAVQKLEAKGYVVRYGVHTTQDDCRMVTMLFALKADDALCEIKQLFVPDRLQRCHRILTLVAEGVIMPDEYVLIDCPSGHEFMARKAQGEVQGPVYQQLICPTCGRRWEPRLQYPDDLTGREI